MEGPFPKKRKSSRKSLGRRVSFAPDAQLETMHLFIKVWQHQQAAISYLDQLDTSGQLCVQMHQNEMSLHCSGGIPQYSRG